VRKYRFIEKLNPRPRYVRYALGYLAGLLVLVFTKTKREGACNLPKEGPFIIAINHFSYIDPLFIISTIQKPISFLAASDQKIKWYFFWAPFIYGFIPTNRKALAPSTIKEAKKALKNKEFLGVFPEGTSTSQTLRAAKKGAAYLSTATETKILPVSICGLENVWSFLRKGVRPIIRIKIGKPFGPFCLPKKKIEREQYLEKAGEEIMCRIAALLPRKQRGVFQGHNRIELLNKQLNT
jgi:1-acyl-sn-glycerol-3-phosphate acyltransferase